MTDGADTSDRGFLSHLCDYRPQLRLLLGLCTVFLLLSLVSLAASEPGTATRAVTVLNLVALTGFSVLFGGILFLCQRR